MLDLSERNIRVAISPTCNFRCIYCDGHHSRRPKKPGAMEDFRRKPIDEGVINANAFIKIINSLCKAGFGGMTLTGGEPFLNPKWDFIIEEACKAGISRVGVTTNGMLLKKYLDKKKKLPEGMTLLTISLDTVDPERFRKISRNGDFQTVMDGLKAAKKFKPELVIRANKVMMQSDLDSLGRYIEFCEESRFIDEINLLNLIMKNPDDREFFETEFVSAQEISGRLSQLYGYDFQMDSKYEFRSQLKSNLRIIIKDTDKTMRNELCSNCPIYCQEGFFTVRVATDGTITTCPDYHAQLPSIDALREIERGTLDMRVQEIVKTLATTIKKNTLKSFFLRYGVHVKNTDY